MMTPKHQNHYERFYPKWFSSLYNANTVDIGSVDLSQVITLQLVFSPAPWVRSVGYTLLMITIR
jgi:hypothetical protein